MKPINTNLDLPWSALHNASNQLVPFLSSSLLPFVCGAVCVCVCVWCVCGVVCSLVVFVSAGAARSDSPAAPRDTLLAFSRLSAKTCSTGPARSRGRSAVDDAHGARVV
jgi:hypothetical protein